MQQLLWLLICSLHNRVNMCSELIPGFSLYITVTMSMSIFSNFLNVRYATRGYISLSIGNHYFTVFHQMVYMSSEFQFVGSKWKKLLRGKRGWLSCLTDKMHNGCERLIQIRGDYISFFGWCSLGHHMIWCALPSLQESQVTALQLPFGRCSCS